MADRQINGRKTVIRSGGWELQVHGKCNQILEARDYSQSRFALATRALEEGSAA